jgi:hypothetical protein
VLPCARSTSRRWVRKPLPETADELCAIAAALGALAQETDTAWLGGRATEGWAVAPA